MLMSMQHGMALYRMGDAYAEIISSGSLSNFRPCSPLRPMTLIAMQQRMCRNRQPSHIHRTISSQTVHRIMSKSCKYVVYAFHIIWAIYLYNYRAF